MIGRLTGIVSDLGHDFIILDVGGIGYNVFTTHRIIQDLFIGQELSLHIEHYLAENMSKLYGFESKKSQKVANILVKVKGINYKIALALLDHLGVDELISVVQNKNEFKLKVKGVGEKLIKRIITETHEDFLKLEPSSHEKSCFQPNQASSEAISALMKLGFQHKSSHRVVAEVISNNPEIKTDELIKLALKSL